VYLSPHCCTVVHCSAVINKQHRFNAAQLLVDNNNCLRATWVVCSTWVVPDSTADEVLTVVDDRRVFLELILTGGDAVDDVRL